MTKQDRLIAANTARLLGYYVLWVDSGEREDGTPLWGDPTTYYALVMCPYYTPIGQGQISFNKRRYTALAKPPDTEYLGHFLVRLHMERHYGIKTPHYWEDEGYTALHAAEQAAGRIVR